jgi:serine/threonine-protein kinase RsbW
METHLRLALRMPRDAATVSTVRRMLDRALAGIGVVDECRADIALALTEACANAVYHPVAGDEYQVVVTVDRHRCVVEVIDGGAGFELGSRNDAGCAVTAERGRGLQLIRAFTDEFEVRPIHPDGVAVRMIKNLTWAADPATTWRSVPPDAWAVVGP